MRRLAFLPVLAAAALPWTAAPATAQETLAIERPTGELGADFDGSWVDFAAAPNAIRRTFQEWLLLRIRGSVVHPKIASFDAILRPVQAQTTWDIVPSSPSGGISRLDGRAGLTLLGGAPISLRLNGLSARETNRGRFGTRTETRLTEWGSSARYRNPYLPAELDYRDALRDILSRTAEGPGYRENDRTRTLRFTARNRKTGLYVERLWFDDRIGARDFASVTGNFDHLYRWGKGSRLRSAFQYLDRTGFAPRRTIFWRQWAHLQHTWTVSSDYEYGIARQEAGGDFTRTRFGRLVATYQPQPELELHASLYGESQRFRIGRQSYYRLGPRIGYARQLARGVHLTTSLMVGYEWHDQKPTAEGTVAVVGERHVIPPSERFTLGQPFADASSVVITSPDGTILYELGLDYRFLSTDPFIEVVVLPGGRLQAGDTVSVDYVREVLPGGSGNALTGDLRLDLRVSSARLYHYRSLQDALGDADVARLARLRNYDDMTTGIAVSVPLAVGSLNVSGEHRRRSARTFDFTTYMLRGGFGATLLRGLRGTLEASAIFQRGGSVQVDMATAKMGAEWAPLAPLRLRSYLSLWSWTEDGRRERFLGGGLGGEYLIGLVSVGLRYDRLSWVDGLDRTEDRLFLRFSRKF